MPRRILPPNRGVCAGGAAWYRPHEVAAGDDAMRHAPELSRTGRIVDVVNEKPTYRNIYVVTQPFVVNPVGQTGDAMRVFIGRVTNTGRV